jgi:hypothetical protein
MFSESTLRWFTDATPLLKRHFGRPSRSALAFWVLTQERQPFYLLEAQLALAQLGIAHSAVTGDINTFVIDGLLARAPSFGRVYFTPTSSPLWDAYSAIARSVGAFETLSLTRKH